MSASETRASRRRVDELNRRERMLAAAQEAHQLFYKAHFEAGVRQLWAALWRRSSELPSGHELLRGATPLAPRPHSVQHIALALITGSEGRSNDFDQAFAPLQDHTRERWQSIAVAWIMGCPLEPVRLVQVGERYLVRDGHHRISVAHTFGAVTIEAIVEQWFALPAPAEICVPLRAPA